MRLLLLLAIAPGAYIVMHVYKQDKIEKEPAKLIRKLLIAGAISVIPAIILELIFSAVFGISLDGTSSLFLIAIDAFIVTALVEEGLKYVTLKKLTWDSPEFDYTFDAIVYSVSVSMGFAIIENIAYVLSNGLGNAIIRAVVSVPGHAVFAIYMGYYYGSAKLNGIEADTKEKSRLLKKALWVPVILHGFFDFCLLSGSTVFILVFLVFIGVLYYLTYKNLKIYSAGDTAMYDD
ncbi:MAG: PrsW family intramembrane metalloprotease [Lachnospiraceae bacterium]|nr:PrsW family intramembrane metalloprotease [Lachnospiraceae bacterium]